MCRICFSSLYQLDGTKLASLKNENVYSCISKSKHDKKDRLKSNSSSSWRNLAGYVWRLAAVWFVICVVTFSGSESLPVLTEPVQDIETIAEYKQSYNLSSNSAAKPFPPNNALQVASLFNELSVEFKGKEHKEVFQLIVRAMTSVK